MVGFDQARALSSAAQSLRRNAGAAASRPARTQSPIDDAPGSCPACGCCFCWSRREAGGPALRLVDRPQREEEDMIHAGDMIENVVTGERLLFHATAADTKGEFVVVEVSVRPKGFVAAAHIHPFQTERFEIGAGTVGFRVGRKKIMAKAGDVVVVEPGTAHKFWNAGDDEARFVTEIQPALQFEQLIETMYGLAADGKTNRKGMPNPLRLAVIAKAHFDDVRLPVVPSWVQRAGLVLGAPIGRMLGYGATYATEARTPALASA